MRVQAKNIKGFNILELLVVMAIIAVVSATAYPQFNSWNQEREVRRAVEEIKSLETSLIKKDDDNKSLANETASKINEMKFSKINSGL